MSIMSNKDKKQTSCLTVLICYTFLAIALGAEIILNGTSMMMLFQLAAKLVICWTIHFIKKYRTAWKSGYPTPCCCTAF